MPSAIDAGTFLSCFVPGIGISQIAGPERPASALAWPNRVDHALSFASAVLQEYTISGDAVFDDCRSQAHTPDILWA